MDPLSQMRRLYDLHGLDAADLAATWHEQLARWVTDAVEAAVPEPNAMVLATADTAGRPSARTVLLKALDERGLVFYTNLRSRKGRELAANPHAALVFPWITLQRQAVVTGTVEPVSDAESDAYFAARPRGAQIGALVSPQSEVIASRTFLDERRASLEQQYPGEVPRPEHWGGLRVVPDAVELWQGRPDRLHDRLRYRRDASGGWVVERLAP